MAGWLAGWLVGCCFVCLSVCLSICVYWCVFWLAAWSFRFANQRRPPRTGDPRRRPGVPLEQASVSVSCSHLILGYRSYLAVGHNQWYHFGVDAPPILVYFGYWGYGILTHGHLVVWTLGVGLIWWILGNRFYFLSTGTGAQAGPQTDHQFRVPDFQPTTKQQGGLPQPTVGPLRCLGPDGV